MKLVPALLFGLSLAVSGTALAQHDTHKPERDSDRRDEQRNEHRDERGDKHRAPPRKGERLAKDHRGARVDYRKHHLKAPPKGHEWRRVDDNYVLISVTTDIISRVVAAGR